MKVAVLVAPRDFRDETLSQIALLFGKKDIEHVIIGFNKKECTGAHGATVKPSAELRELHPEDFDALLIVDGPGVDSMKIYDHRPLLDTIKAFHESRKTVIGIGNSVKAVARANVIKDTKIAKPDKETENLVVLYRGIPTEEPLILDKKILTVSSSDGISDMIELLSKS